MSDPYARLNFNPDGSITLKDSARNPAIDPMRTTHSDYVPYIEAGEEEVVGRGDGVYTRSTTRVATPDVGGSDTLFGRYTEEVPRLEAQAAALAKAGQVSEAKKIFQRLDAYAEADRNTLLQFIGNPAPSPMGHIFTGSAQRAILKSWNTEYAELMDPRTNPALMTSMLSLSGIPPDSEMYRDNQASLAETGQVNPLTRAIFGSSVDLSRNQPVGVGAARGQQGIVRSNGAREVSGIAGEDAAAVYSAALKLPGLLGEDFYSALSQREQISMAADIARTSEMGSAATETLISGFMRARGDASGRDPMGNFYKTKDDLNAYLTIQKGLMNAYGVGLNGVDGTMYPDSRKQLYLSKSFQEVAEALNYEAAALPVIQSSVAGAMEAFGHHAGLDEDAFARLAKAQAASAFLQQGVTNNLTESTDVTQLQGTLEDLGRLINPDTMITSLGLGTSVGLDRATNVQEVRRGERGEIVTEEPARLSLAKGVLRDWSANLAVAAARDPSLDAATLMESERSSLARRLVDSFPVTPEAADQIATGWIRRLKDADGGRVDLFYTPSPPVDEEAAVEEATKMIDIAKREEERIRKASGKEEITGYAKDFIEAMRKVSDTGDWATGDGDWNDVYRASKNALGRIFNDAFGYDTQALEGEDFTNENSAFFKFLKETTTGEWIDAKTDREARAKLYDRGMEALTQQFKAHGGEELLNLEIRSAEQTKKLAEGVLRQLEEKYGEKTEDQPEHVRGAISALRADVAHSRASTFKTIVAERLGREIDKIASRVGVQSSRGTISRRTSDQQADVEQMREMAGDETLHVVYGDDGLKRLLYGATGPQRDKKFLPDRTMRSVARGLRSVGSYILGAETSRAHEIDWERFDIRSIGKGRVAQWVATLAGPDAAAKVSRVMSWRLPHGRLAEARGLGGPPLAVLAILADVTGAESDADYDRMWYKDSDEFSADFFRMVLSGALSAEDAPTGVGARARGLATSFDRAREQEVQVELDKYRESIHEGNKKNAALWEAYPESKALTTLKNALSAAPAEQHLMQMLDLEGPFIRQFAAPTNGSAMIDEETLAGARASAIAQVNAGVPVPDVINTLTAYLRGLQSAARGRAADLARQMTEAQLTRNQAAAVIAGQKAAEAGSGW